MSDQPVSNTASGLDERIAWKRWNSIGEPPYSTWLAGAMYGWDARDEEVKWLTADWQKEHTAKVDAKVDLDRLESENKRLREALEAARPWLKLALDSDYFEGHGNLKRAICLVNEALALKDTSGR